MRPKKKRKEQPVHHLTQEELLAEAAYTEIANLRSLEALQAAEEEVKKRAAVKRVGYSGPCVRLRSKQINGEGLVSPVCTSRCTGFVFALAQNQMLPASRQSTGDGGRLNS